MEICHDQECILMGNKDCSGCPYDSDVDREQWERVIRPVRKGKSEKEAADLKEKTC